MNSQSSFLAFAEAFETGFATRDWSITGRLMTDDVVWSLAELPPPIGGTHVGRAQALDAIRLSTDVFDRRFDRREPLITDGPREIPGGIHMTWAVTYTRAGLPPFVLLGEEWDLFRDGKLEVHRERVHNLAEMWTYVATHESRLAPPPADSVAATG